MNEGRLDATTWYTGKAITDKKIYILTFTTVQITDSHSFTVNMVTDPATNIILLYKITDFNNNFFDFQ